MKEKQRCVGRERQKNREREKYVVGKTEKECERMQRRERETTSQITEERKKGSKKERERER